MTMMGKTGRGAVAFLMTLAMLALFSGTGEAEATEIRYVVNNTPITSYDIARRAAFLRLQRQGGNLNDKAAEEMIDQVLKLQEMQRLGINITSEMVEQAYQRFASSNKMSASQMNTILAQAGVTADHFKEFIRTQIGWSRALQARNSGLGQLTEQDVVARMLQQGGQKPSATEYTLQQVIFVVPAGQRGQLLGKRKREAQAMRDRFRGCETTHQFAKGLIDVTVRDLGRVLEPELPPDWKDLVTTISPGEATRIRETDRGVEFIGICTTREVSDDRVAQLVFQSEGDSSKASEEATRKYLVELRENARISKR